MPKVSLVFAVFFLCLTAVCAETGSEFKLALVDHPGQLSWSADGYEVIQSSAKPNGNEVGIRGRNKAGITFLGFLFLVPEQAPLTSAKCRDGALNSEKGSNSALQIQSKSEITGAGSLPVSMVSYTTKRSEGKSMYVVRGFVASADMCGDLEFYSDSPISANDAVFKKVFSGYRLDEKYTPTFNDIFIYAQILYKEQQFKAAAPMFERALTILKESREKGQTTSRRVLTDQAGMAYGISGDIRKARSIFEKGISEDPDYPLYYYNLACADAEEKNLTEAQKHLREAFDRSANVLEGEAMPDPTTDDSFTPFRQNKQFWSFLESLKPRR